MPNRNYFLVLGGFYADMFVQQFCYTNFVDPKSFGVREKNQQELHLAKKTAKELPIVYDF
jgi:hypothetical protein